MRTHAIVSLPLDVSAELIGAGMARPYPPTTRGAGLPEMVTLGIEGVKDATAVVVLLLNLEACRKLLVELLKRHKRTDAPTDMVTLSIMANGKSESITIDPALAGAQDQALEFLLTAFR